MTKAALLEVEKITKEKWYYDDLFDPVIAVKAGSIYFNMLLNRFKQDETLAVLAYSWLPMLADAPDGALVAPLVAARIGLMPAAIMSFTVS